MIIVVKNHPSTKLFDLQKCVDSFCWSWQSSCFVDICEKTEQGGFISTASYWAWPPDLLCAISHCNVISMLSFSLQLME